MDHAAKLKCVVVTPEMAVLDESADFVAVPMYDGELGVLRGRAPMIGRLGVGELRIQQGNTTKRYFVDGGFVQVRSDVISVLTSKAMPVEAIDVATAKIELTQALATSTKTEAEAAAAKKAQASARAKIRMAER